MPANIQPGFIALHGNQLEQLRAAVFQWVRDNPLAPLEEEIILVQSNGVAEWLKISLAQAIGVCASTRITLPARFLWEVYRGMLGWEQVPRRSAYDRAPLTWRLMQLLPGLLRDDAFAPLRHFLGNGNPDRRLQLAQRLSDLFDQYQVYRAGWLREWASGADIVRDARDQPVPLAADQLWQPRLWRAIIAGMPEAEREGGRADVHGKFIDACKRGAAPQAGMPRRVIVFGISALPYQTLEALGALSQRMQVILAVPNPCQFYWGDIISGRDLLKAQRRRQQHRNGRDLGETPLEDMHAHCHPLLAGWGRLGRDFIRMLDEFDDAEKTRADFSSLRVDLFSDDEGGSVLAQAQSAIRDLLPLSEHAFPTAAAGDDSVEFHIAHSAQREVEILHDRLLALFADPSRGIRPRDVVVMAPDIEAFTPAIRAVFDQYQRDARHIPYEIANVAERRVNPLLVALDWLLRLPEQRCLQSEVRDLLDVPAIAARFGIAQADLPRIGQWIEASGVRWGLDKAHREALELGPAGEKNAWIFGVRRMLLGYASGAGASFAGIEPFAQVGGLDAALAGSLADFIEQLLRWRALLARPARPAAWGELARRLRDDFFHIEDERDRLTCAQLDQSLENWLEDCALAGFDEPVPLLVLREAWLASIDEHTLNQRFVSGGVTFCTLIPMRAVPFRMVCLIGMNDGDFPRRAQRADFDLLALPGLARPGDRSRRDDDRYLMLEALLAARDKLYVSWVGRSVRDNSEQPPSVLVAQLRDYLCAGWGLDLNRVTTEHPLQPFSRSYFEAGGLRTYAREWRQAHAAALAMPAPAAPLPVTAEEARLRLQDLEGFVRQPVRQFFRRRLKVHFGEQAPVGCDDEPFALDKLEEYALCEFMLADSGPQESVQDVPRVLRARAARLEREGRLPIGHLGVLWQERMVDALAPARIAWISLCERFPPSTDRIPVSFERHGVAIEDWLDKIRRDGAENVWLTQTPGEIWNGAVRNPQPRQHKMIGGWVRQLLLSAQNRRVRGFIVGRDRIVEMLPMEPYDAELALEMLLALWREGMARPLPTACRTALQLIAGKSPAAAYDGGEFMKGLAESADLCLARLWPDFAALEAEPDWERCSRQLYEPLVKWIESSTRIHPLGETFTQKAAA